MKNRGKIKILKEVLVIYAAVVFPVAALYPVRNLPFISSFIWPVALALQIYLPIWLFLNRRWNLSLLGLHLVNWKRALRDSLLAVLLLFPPAILGHHYWQKWLGREFYPSKLSLLQLPYSMRVQSEFPLQHSKSSVVITADPDRPILNFYSRIPGIFVRLIAWDGHLLFLGGNASLQGPPVSQTLELYSASKGSFFRVQIEARKLSIEIWSGGKLLQSKEIGLGPEETFPSSNPIIVERNYLWLLYIFFVQIFLVALPEELFYRGYILYRLNKIFPQSLRLFGLNITLGNLLTSILFALTHLLIGFSPHRLGVFFPSLVFGILRERSGTLAGSVLFHGLSNILMKILEKFYI